MVLNTTNKNNILEKYGRVTHAIKCRLRRIGQRRRYCLHRNPATKKFTCSRNINKWIL